MKVKELIEQLQKIPQDIEVVVFDWRKNVYNSNGDDPCNIGITPIVEVAHETDSVTKPFVSIYYENDDYTKKGEANYGGLLYENASKE